jgi:hypothetical protein
MFRRIPSQNRTITTTQNWLIPFSNAEYAVAITAGNTNNSQNSMSANRVSSQFTTSCIIQAYGLAANNDYMDKIMCIAKGY